MDQYRLVTPVCSHPGLSRRLGLSRHPEQREGPLSMHLVANTHFVISSNELALAARTSAAEGLDMTAMTIAPLSAIAPEHPLKRCA